MTIYLKTWHKPFVTDGFQMQNKWNEKKYLLSMWQKQHK